MYANNRPILINETSSKQRYKEKACRAIIRKTYRFHGRAKAMC